MQSNPRLEGAEAKRASARRHLNRVAYTSWAPQSSPFIFHALPYWAQSKTVNCARYSGSDGACKQTCVKCHSSVTHPKVSTVTTLARPSFFRSPRIGGQNRSLEPVPPCLQWVMPILKGTEILCSAPVSVTANESQPAPRVSIVRTHTGTVSPKPTPKKSPTGASTLGCVSPSQ